MKRNLSRVVLEELDPEFLQLRDERDAVLYFLEQIIKDLPTNRDWLDPQLEKLAKAAIAKAKGATP